MGSIVSDATGKGSDSGEAAANAANAASKREIEELQRQFNITQGNIQPFLDAGTELLPQQVGAATLGGLDDRLGQILNADNFSNLVDARRLGIEGQLEAGGLTRSGAALDEMTALPAELGLQIENLLAGRTSQLTGSAQNAASGLSALGQQNSQAIGGAFAQQGQNTASGILADQQADAQTNQNILQAGAAAAAIFFSDPRLKENVEKISEIKDLSVFQWDWIPKAQDTIIGQCQTIGFMADEVEDKYPHHVSEFGGFKVIDYEALLNEMKEGVYNG